MNCFPSKTAYLLGIFSVGKMVLYTNMLSYQNILWIYLVGPQWYTHLKNDDKQYSSHEHHDKCVDEPGQPVYTVA